MGLLHPVEKISRGVFLRMKAMTTIHFAGKAYVCEPRQTLLDCLQTQGATVPSGCRSGICQSCLMRAQEGAVPSLAQQGLSPHRAAQGYLLACCCIPEGEMTVTLPDTQGLTCAATVLQRVPLNGDICALRLHPDSPLDYRAGQYLRLYHQADTSRCYSLASVPTVDDYLEFHIRRIPGGRVSGWVHDDLQPGDRVMIGEAVGDCVYDEQLCERTLLLVGTGSGLAPLYGIVRDALSQQHTGPIWLYHGSFVAQGLYLQPELRALAARFPNFHYVPCVDRESVESQAWSARVMTALDAVMADHRSFSGYRVYLCGHPDMVNAARLKIFVGGASMSDILADPFLPSGPS